MSFQTPETVAAVRTAMTEVDRVTAKGPFRPAWDSLTGYRVPQWYADAKFGIFIHWGAYAVPAFGNEWYPRNMYRQGTPEFEHHVKTYGPHKQFGYKDFIPQFKAEQFDAAVWAALFREAGARFVVPVAEHHDGFAMYDSRLSRWTAAQMGPRRDVVAELAKATRAAGMTFGVSSHRAEHWWFMDGGRQSDSDVTDDRFADLYGPAQPKAEGKNADRVGPGADQAFLDDWLARCCELVDKYHPQIVWFDWWIKNLTFERHLQRFAAYYYNRGHEWGMGVAINYKDDAFPDGAAVYDVERGQLADTRPMLWQTDTAVAKNSWCYTEGNAYKAPADIVHDLVDIVSKNGCLLLNVGPRADGTIPDEDARILRATGNWLAVNGEAVYDTRPWKVYGEGPTQVVAGGFSDTKRQPFTPRDVRFTTKGDALYAVCLGTDVREVVVRSLASGLRLYTKPIGQVELVGGDGGPLAWACDERGLVVQLPERKPSEFAVTLKVTPKA